MCTVPIFTDRSQLSNKSQDEERDGRGEKGRRRSQKAGGPIQRGTQGSCQRCSTRFIHHTLHLSQYRYIRCFEEMKSKEATQSIQMRQIMHYKLQKKYAYCFAPVSRSVVFQRCLHDSYDKNPLLDRQQTMY